MSESLYPLGVTKSSGHIAILVDEDVIHEGTAILIKSEYNETNIRWALQNYFDADVLNLVVTSDRVKADIDDIPFDAKVIFALPY